VKFATDKVDHGYLPSYLRIAAQLGAAGRVCEVGVWHGGSMHMWQALFPAGLVCGVDADPAASWPPGTIRIVSPQDDAELPEILGKHARGWDLIVDDASHDGPLTRATFDLLWPLVRPGGFYVIEDWMIGLPSWPQYGTGMLQSAQGLLTLLERDSDVEDITFRYGLAVLRKKGRLNG
jgi:predicted O-methyltransferase YrrM